MQRSYFLRSILGLLGIATTPTVISCEKENDADTQEPQPMLSEEDAAYAARKERAQTDGFFREGTALYLDITHNKYSALATQEGNLNDTENYLLLLRSSSTKIKAFSNCCPHWGTSNLWTYTQGNFRCNNHGNTYSTGTGNFVACNSGRRSGNLKQYLTELDRDILYVDLS